MFAIPTIKITIKIYEFENIPLVGMAIPQLKAFVLRKRTMKIDKGCVDFSLLSIIEIQVQTGLR